MDINYESYKVFYLVATTLSFSEASKRLYISQSAVSQSVKGLKKTRAAAVYQKHKKCPAYASRTTAFKPYRACH